jgi:hypothetical protein
MLEEVDMRRAMTAVLAPMFLLLACGAEEATAPLGQSAEVVGGEISISGHCEGSFDFIPIDFLPPPQDDLAAHARLPGRGVCRLTHLGKATYADDLLVDFTGDPFVGTGTRVFIAANGDELRAAEETATPGPGASPQFITSGTFTFDGGTGRFVNASGSARFTGGGSIEDNSAFLSLEGTIVLAP